MLKKISAGLLMYQIKNSGLEVFLAHPGGPFFKNKDAGYWSIPKGIVEEKEKILDTAAREFEEEVGIKPEGEFTNLGSVEQKNNKIVYAWAFEGKSEPPQTPKSNLTEIEWPPKSGKKQKFPEIDKAQFFPADEAKIKINQAQKEFIERLEKFLKEN